MTARDITTKNEEHELVHAGRHSIQREFGLGRCGPEAVAQAIMEVEEGLAPFATIAVTNHPLSGGADHRCTQWFHLTKVFDPKYKCQTWRWCDAEGDAWSGGTCAIVPFCGPGLAIILEVVAVATYSITKAMAEFTRVTKLDGWIFRQN